MARTLVGLVVSFAIVLGALACASSEPSGSDEPDPEPAHCTAPEPAPPPPCPDGWFHYIDFVCPYPPGTPCYESGDGLCHRPCEKNADCVDPCKPNCTELTLCGGSDACFQRENVCF